MKRIRFSSSDSQLQGYYFKAAASSPAATVVFLQGFPGVEGDELICQRLADEHINVLAFNYRGTFQSEGVFSFSNAIADIAAAFRYLQEPEVQKDLNIDPQKIILGGWSFGSGILPVGAAAIPDVEKLFMISGRDFGKEARRINADPQYARQVDKNLQNIRYPDGPVKFNDDLVDDLGKKEGAFDIARLSKQLKTRDILLIAGWDDSVIGIEDHLLPFYRSLVEAGAEKVRLEAWHDDHEFENTRDRLVAVIRDWILQRG